MATIQNPQRFFQEFLNVEANESSERILTSSNDPMIHDERCAKIVRLWQVTLSQYRDSEKNIECK